VKREHLRREDSPTLVVLVEIWSPFLMYDLINR
jgi:hypothetical protein